MHMEGFRSDNGQIKSDDLVEEMNQIRINQADKMITCN